MNIVAGIAEKAGFDHQAAYLYEKAALMKANLKDFEGAVIGFDKSAGLYESAGNVPAAAKLYAELAINFSDKGEFKKSALYFKKLSELFSSLDSTSASIFGVDSEALAKGFAAFSINSLIGLKLNHAIRDSVVDSFNKFFPEVKDDFRKFIKPNADYKEFLSASSRINKVLEGAAQNKKFLNGLDRILDVANKGRNNYRR